MTSRKLPILVVAGVGNGTGTGASTARLFAKNGYRVAVVARNPDSLQKLADDINSSGGEAAPFPIETYTHDNVKSVFDAIKKQWPNDEIRAALWNAGAGVWKPFLDVTESDIRQSLENNVIGAFAFARESILAMKDLELNENGKKGTLLFTSATAALRGNVVTSAFAAGKFGQRALSQSLAKEFGKQNIHVASVVVDGQIATGRTSSYGSADTPKLSPDSIAKTYLNLTNQDSSAWTWELDLRPSSEKW
ncbi:hypothetical protein FRC03_007923 [Tulasnella sp. 419]|nr:hypothetical protein FRC03_007923 [Tulasnella sp. 419]